jgi:hypothetical protein
MTRTPVSNAQVLEINWSQLLKSKGRSDGSSDLNVSKGVLIAAGAVFLAALGEVSSSDRQPRHDAYTADGGLYDGQPFEQTVMPSCSDVFGFDM